MAVRAQRSEERLKLAAGQAGTLLVWNGLTEADRVLVYAVSSDSTGTGLLTVTERMQRGGEEVRQITVGPGGAGRLRVNGSVQVDVVAGAFGNLDVTACMLDGAVELSPPLDTFAGLVGGVGGGPWLDVGPLAGFPPGERRSVQVATDNNAVDFRLIDAAGAVVYGQWTVTGLGSPLYHPPRLRLQARNPAAAGTVRYAACWLGGP